MGRFRLTYPTAMVMQSLARGQQYGFEIAATVGLRPGSVYQVLRRLEDAGYVTGTWEDADGAHAEGRPPRRFYQLNEAVSRDLLVEIARRFPSLDDVPATASRERLAGEGQA